MVSQTDLVTSSAVSSTIATSSSSNTWSGFSSDPTSPPPRYWQPRLQIGPIVGGVVAVFALILLFIYLLLKHRASQREIRLRAEMNPNSTPFDVITTRQGLSRHVSVNNDDGSRPVIMPSPTVYPSQTMPPANVSLKRVHTNYTVHSPIHDDGIHIALEYTSDTNSQAEGQFQSNSSHDLIPNGAMMTRTPSTYIPGQSPSELETHLETDYTNISTDYAPPAYDTLPARTAP